MAGRTTMMRTSRLCCGALLCVLFCAYVNGQTCPAPVLPSVDPHSDIFSPQQETDLGDALAEQVQRDFLVIDDPDLTNYLQRVGDRVLGLSQMNGMKVRFFLFDLPTANAFSLPGGRIYVSRKIVGFLHGEDELASVLGHELGHVLSKQPAIAMTQGFR